MKVGIIGLGFVGTAIYKSFELKKIELRGYDKFKEGGIGTFEECLDTEILFLALPTLYEDNLGEYNKSAIHETCQLLHDNKYDGVVVIKSTVEPGTTDSLSDKYNLNFVHNPEFLTARTAFEDFHNQKHIVLGKSKKCESDKYELISEFFKQYYTDAEISKCKSLESESMKIFVNSYYAVKIQFFNELYLLCQNNGSDYETIKNLMLKNGWINSMHTNVPGPDGKLSYGGACFPKDTSALNKYMERLSSPNEVLNATISERNKFRKD
jgi:UDPglucose 6-dehydrogenase